MTYNVVYLEDNNLEIKINTLTNKGKVINIIPTNYTKLYITDLTLNNKKIPHENDNTFLRRNLIPIVPHLCTKDNIKIGDKCKWKQPTTGKWFDITIDEKTDINFLKQEETGRGLVKVLGKISDNALWINETYTLTDNDIYQFKKIITLEDDYGVPNPDGWIKHDILEVTKDFWSDEPYYHSHKLLYKRRWKDEPDEADFEITYNIYEIKCPCCSHFH